MVEDAIKQTRCSTCDFEHPYKDGKVPPRRKKKDAPSALFQQVLDGVMEGRVLSPAPALVAPAAVPAPAPVAVPPVAASEVAAVPAVAVEEAAPLQPTPVKRKATRTRFVPEEPLPAPVAAVPAPVAAPAAPVVRGVLRPASSLTASLAAAPGANAASTAPSTASPSSEADPASQDPASAPMALEDPEDGPLYRRNLIRATLPRPVGEVPVRQMPTFTIREAAAARPNKFRPKHRPQGVGMGTGPRQHGSGNNQMRQTSGRGPQGARPGVGKKTGGAPNHSGNQAHGGKNRQGGHGNKRFK